MRSAVEGPEAALVQVERVEEGGGRGASGAAADDERLGEGLEGADDLQHEVEEDDRRQHGDRDVPEPPHGAGPVDRRRLVAHGRDLPQSGEEDDHRSPEGPHVEHDEGAQRVVGVEHPSLALDAEEGQDLVDEAVGAEDLAPQDGHRDASAQQRGQVVD